MSSVDDGNSRLNYLIDQSSSCGAIAFEEAVLVWRDMMTNDRLKLIALEDNDVAIIRNIYDTCFNYNLKDIKWEAKR